MGAAARELVERLAGRCDRSGSVTPMQSNRACARLYARARPWVGAGELDGSLSQSRGVHVALRDAGNDSQPFVSKRTETTAGISPARTNALPASSSLLARRPNDNRSPNERCPRRARAARYNPVAGESRENSAVCARQQYRPDDSDNMTWTADQVGRRSNAAISSAYGALVDALE